MEQNLGISAKVAGMVFCSLCILSFDSNLSHKICCGIFDSWHPVSAHKALDSGIFYTEILKIKTA